MFQLYCIAYFSLCITALAQGIELDNGIEENINHNITKSSRFISLNNHDGEIKIELDFAVPFMKIPVGSKRAGLIKPSIDVNTRGLVTVGAMLFLFVTVVPKIVQLVIPEATVTTTDGLLPIMRRVEETLESMNIPTTGCYQRSACMLANRSKVSFEDIKNYQWMSSMIENDSIQDAVAKGLNGGDCSEFNCPLSMSSITNLFKTG